MLLPYYKKGFIEAGCDEAGRGCLAGSVYAAAVILPPDYHNEVLNDSKQLSEKLRYQLRTEIERDAIAWAVGVRYNPRKKTGTGYFYSDNTENPCYALPIRPQKTP